MDTNRIPQVVVHTLHGFLGEKASLVWEPIGGHNVWRVRTNNGCTMIAKQYNQRKKLSHETLVLDTLKGCSATPNLLASDEDAGVLIFEDIGEETLTDLLLGADPSRATTGLIELAKILARIRALAPNVPASLPTRETEWPTTAFLNICGALHVNVKRETLDEIYNAENILAQKSGLVHGDICPDNFVVSECGGRLVDFTTVHAGNPLLDVVAVCVPFPTCWQVGVLPHTLSERLFSEYCEELSRLTSGSRAKPAASDHAAASVYWLVHFTTQKHWLALVDNPLARDLASTRQRMIIWLEGVRSILMQHDHFLGTSELISDLRSAIRDRWPSLPSPPYYPAFRDAET